MRQFSEQEKVRREKLENIKYFCNPYPDKFDVNYSLDDAGKLEDGVCDVAIAGRIVFLRKMGKMSFLRLRDIESSIQVSIKIDEIGEDNYAFFKTNIDVGDYVGINGEVFTTQTGEKTIRAKSITFLGKALRPLPEKFHGLQDVEMKYRERYVDLITNEDSRNLFLGRSKFYYFLRNFMYENNFLEVETPILQTTVSGASAKPFFTHHNALNMDCNLRIAPECYLKECIAGGFNRVYEVAKCFRNEGMDPQHLQEFTQIEWYAAYWNFEDNISFFKKFMCESAKAVKGSTIITLNGEEIDLSDEWTRINYVEELTKILGFDFLSVEEPEILKDKIVETGLFTLNDLIECKSLAQIIDYVYKRTIREGIVKPTVIWNYPAVLKPLARRNDSNHDIVDVFQVVIAGAEVCNAYSELVNPEIQRSNFEDQLKQKSQGDDETMDLDENYLKAMEQGMPPISGLGVGIDRLMMLLFNADSVRDVVLFPMMKPDDMRKKIVSNNVPLKETVKVDLSNIVIEPLFDENVDFDTFSKSDFRVVKVLDCIPVPKSKKLLQFTLDDGTGSNRTILSGIHAYYEPEELIGKTLVAITNLPPRKMIGIDSCGMLLSAVCKNGEDELLNLLMLDDNIPAGSKLY